MNKNGSSPVKEAVNNFFRTTTLHGFKYLLSKYYYDRVGWVLLCCASTICAANLCSVLWARFMEVPALLELIDIHASQDVTEYWPDIAICPPVMLSSYFMKELNMNSSMSNRLSRTVSHVLTGKPTAPDQLIILEQFLLDHNITLDTLLLKNTPACNELAVTCRWQKSIVPCQYIFEKEQTTSGVCCIMKPERAYNRLIHTSFQPTAFFEQNRELDVLLQCSNVNMAGCTFFTKYSRETNVQSVTLGPSLIYIAQLKLTSVPMSSTEELKQSACNTDVNYYSKDICLEECAERHCKCSDPVRYKDGDKIGKLPPCAIRDLACLRRNGSHDDPTCKCLPSCDKITSDLNLGSIALDSTIFTLDPVYADMNNMSTVLHIRLNIALSRKFTLNPSETWFTLLSSLGGVFNMFLGVGLFSALEVLFLLLIKLPGAYRKSRKVIT